MKIVYGFERGHTNAIILLITFFESFVVLGEPEVLAYSLNPTFDGMFFTLIFDGGGVGLIISTLFLFVKT